MSRLMKLVDNIDPDSYAARMRRKRFALFRTLLQGIPRPLEILDIGGTQEFWEIMDFTDVPGISVTLVNLQRPDTWYENFSGLAGNATDLSELADNQFDVVFSNSVIEHVGSYQQQRLMAQEVRRVGERYFVQTPNYYFPIEPHFLLPGFQWLPRSVRVLLVSHFSLGWMQRMPDPVQARELVESTRLLRKQELLTLFPGAEIYEERMLGLTKSFVAYGGWQNPATIRPTTP
jgi:hypothetical protein